MIALVLRWLLATCGWCAVAMEGSETPRSPAAAQVAAWARELPAGGVVAVLVDAAGARFYAGGTRRVGDPRPLGPDSIFALGGLTQSFVALLWAQLVQEGALARDARLAEVWRSGPWGPETQGASPLLTGLLTHTAGLPQLPPVLVPRGAAPAPDQPFARFDRNLLRSFFQEWRTPEDGASPYAPSLLGYAAVARALEEHLGEPLGWALGRHVLEPLGMHSTSFTPAPGEENRFAWGHRGRQPVRPWDWGALQGGGGLLGSARDLAEFVRFTVGLRDGPREALGLTTQPLGSTDLPEVRVTPGWLLRLDPANGPLFYQRGDTAGCSSILAFNLERRVGVAVVSNTDRRVDRLALTLYRWLLDNARFPEG